MSSAQSSNATESWFRLRYRKDAELRFLGHLDTTRLLLRLLRRARLPLALTGGFSPHPRIASGPPLPVGFVSEVEFIDFALQLDEESQSPAADRIAENACERLRQAQEARQVILSVRALREGEQRVSRLAATAKYALVFVDDRFRRALTPELVEAGLAGRTGIAESAESNPSKLPSGLISWEVHDGVLHLHASAGGANPLSLSIVVKRLAECSNLRFLIGERTGLYDKQGNPVG